VTSALDSKSIRVSAYWRLKPIVDALPVLRGVTFTVAVILVAELGDLIRFDHPSELMKDLGLTPAASSSVERRPTLDNGRNKLKSLLGGPSASALS